MKRARVGEQIMTQVRSTGQGIATGMEEVSREVVAFYKGWMGSRVSWDQRWKSWNGMMELDTDALVRCTDKEFVTLAYRDSYEKFNRLQKDEGVWDVVWDHIEMEDVENDLQGLKSGKAGGPEGITNDVRRAVAGDNMGTDLGGVQAGVRQRGH